MPSWSQILDEIKGYALEHPEQKGSAYNVIRQNYLKALSEETGRNVIAYYSSWLSKPGIRGLEISDEDKSGFMSAIYGLERNRGLDLILHTPGGDVTATQSIVYYLRKMFGNDIRAIVPQLAMSAGTMVACSCKSILMGLHSNLGPIDPHLRDIPAVGVIKEFRRASRAIRRDPSNAFVWQFIIGQYRPTFLSQCENAVRLSSDFVREQLTNVMFGGTTDAAARAAVITKKLSDYSGNKSHSRHIEVDECEDIGLNIERLEANPVLQEKVLSVHHSFSITLSNTSTGKIIENQDGAAFVKYLIPQQQGSVQPLPTQ